MTRKRPVALLSGFEIMARARNLFGVAIANDSRLLIVRCSANRNHPHA